MGTGVASIKITGNVTEAIASLEALGIKAETTAAKTEAAFGDKLVSGVSGTFSKIATATQGLPIVGGMFKKMSEDIAKADTKAQGLVRSLGAVGKLVAIAGVAGVAVVGVESVKAATSFQASMELIHTNAGVAQNQNQKPVELCSRIGRADSYRTERTVGRPVPSGVERPARQDGGVGVEGGGGGRAGRPGEPDRRDERFGCGDRLPNPGCVKFQSGDGCHERDGRRR